MVRISPFVLAFGAALAASTSPAAAQITRAGPDASPIAASVTVPPGATTVYLSGALASEADPSAPEGSVERWGDTETQTRSVLKKLADGLAAQGMGPGDVVMMRVYLVAPPGAEKMDFAGMMKAYREMFGTAEQPNKPARVTVEVAALAAPQFLVEIEVQAAKVVEQ